MFIDIYEFISNKSELTFTESGSLEMGKISDEFILKSEPKYNLVLTKVDQDDIYLNLEINYDFETECNRCLIDVNQSQPIDYQAKLVDEYPEEDDDEEYQEYVVYENSKFDLSELVRQLILLSMPFKILCDLECKGICPQCGQDLNDGECKCEEPVGDLRFAILEDLVLEDEEE